MDLVNQLHELSKSVTQCQREILAGPVSQALTKTTEVEKLGVGK